MVSRPLSERQKAMLDYIASFIEDNGYPPTIREIGEACDIPSTSVVNYNLNRLEREGFIAREGKVSRGIRLVKSLRGPLDQNIVVRIPLVGQIVASEPVPIPGSDFSYFDPEEAIELTRDVVREDAELFALKVKGESMIDAMINDGDIVVMKPQPSPNNGELVAVWLADKEETTLKRFFLEGGKVRLQPENSTMDPIIIDDPSTVMVQGRVVAVVRKIH